MRIEVISTVDEVMIEHIKHKTVIVIDVLRASSTIATALAHGATKVIPVDTIGQANLFRQEGYLLAGERYGKKVIGFPFTNSPIEMTQAPLKGNALVLTTTNGTRAIQKSWKAASTLIGSFLNSNACAQLAMQLKRDLTILCAGSRQQFSFEDGLCAGYIVSLIEAQVPHLFVNDLGKTLSAAYRYVDEHLPAVLKTSAAGKRLVQSGQEDDVAYCAQKDIYSFVPTLVEDAIIIPADPF
ncbi:hypothetical protein BEP19_01070 [Ammoniphilus oxalaticus]|uniref:Probable 2-phosphosulfolactate phosphatase n=1 Tax=Ammoniphilus oxalaticus TaxID=66863 RepID=A0A419SMQ8_9BACL|nr:2-phosphosulfolactate phosphatase [Ammoniphilus oxalaticus]RKD25565.1 hypothetical protein BEP19_01070 [Ammoniphilus oxalaticus]